MKRKVVSLLGVAALVLGAAILVAPPASDAVIITDVLVNVGGVTWCNTGFVGTCTNKIWTLPASLAPGTDLILAQTNGFNFDSSQRNGGADCSNALGTPCNTLITINTIPMVVTNAANSVLAFGNNDLGGTVTNEAANYVPAGSGTGFNAFIGYYDNVHSAACADTTGTGILGNCQPDPVTLSSNAVGALNPGISESLGSHCGNAPAGGCFDSGVLRIVAVSTGIPEPSTLLLLGTGLLGVAAWSRRRLQGKN